VGSSKATPKRFPFEARPLTLRSECGAHGHAAFGTRRHLNPSCSQPWCLVGGDRREDESLDGEIGVDVVVANERHHIAVGELLDQADRVVRQGVL